MCAGGVQEGKENYCPSTNHGSPQTCASNIADTSPRRQEQVLPGPRRDSTWCKLHIGCFLFLPPTPRPRSVWSGPACPFCQLTSIWEAPLCHHGALVRVRMVLPTISRGSPKDETWWVLLRRVCVCVSDTIMCIPPLEQAVVPELGLRVICKSPLPPLNPSMSHGAHPCRLAPQEIFESFCLRMEQHERTEGVNRRVALCMTQMQLSAEVIPLWPVIQ